MAEMEKLECKEKSQGKQKDKEKNMFGRLTILEVLNNKHGQ